MRRRHPHVDDHDVRPGQVDLADQLLGRSHLGDDVESGLAEQPVEALAEQHVVVCDHDSQGITTRIVEVPSRPRSTAITPSIAPTRSRQLDAIGHDLQALDRHDEVAVATGGGDRDPVVRRHPVGAPRPPRSTRPTRRGIEPLPCQLAQPDTGLGVLDERFERRREALLRQDRGEDAGREFPKVDERGAQLVARLVQPAEGSASSPARERVLVSESDSASETSRCWAPSCRSRSSRRRSASPAAMMRARDSRSCSSCARASAWRRSLSSTSRAAAAISRAERRLVGDAVGVHQDGELLAVADEPRDVWPERDGAAAGVDEAAVARAGRPAPATGSSRMPARTRSSPPETGASADSTASRATAERTSRACSQVQATASAIATSATACATHSLRSTASFPSVPVLEPVPGVGGDQGQEDGGARQDRPGRPAGRPATTARGVRRAARPAPRPSPATPGRPAVAASA